MLRMLLIGMIAVLASPNAIAASPTIKEIVEAGITGCTSAPSDFGPEFWKHVDRKCRGKSSCKVGVTGAYPLATLKRYGCTAYFINFICGKSPNKEVSAPRLEDSVTLRCN